MKTPINEKNIYKKGEMILNNFGWAGIVMEATRGNNPTIINMVEVFGFEHECGSMYASDVVARLTTEQFETYKAKLGHAEAEHYFKGTLIEPK